MHVDVAIWRDGWWFLRPQIMRNVTITKHGWYVYLMVGWRNMGAHLELAYGGR